MIRQETKMMGRIHVSSIQVGDKTVQARITCTEKERQRGLMHVKSMPENEECSFSLENQRSTASG